MKYCGRGTYQIIDKSGTVAATRDIQFRVNGPPRGLNGEARMVRIVARLANISDGKPLGTIQTYMAPTSRSNLVNFCRHERVRALI